MNLALLVVQLIVLNGMLANSIHTVVMLHNMFTKVGDTVKSRLPIFESHK